MKVSALNRFKLYGLAALTPVVLLTAHAAAQGSWTPVGSMPVARINAAVVTASDGRVYAIGGSYGNISDNIRVLNHVDVYDPETDNWRAVCPMPTARGGIAAALGPDGLIYVFGGYAMCDICPTDTVEAYDPTTDTWTTKTPMPTARYHLAAATGVDGRIYVIGGALPPNPDPIALDTVEAYDPVTDSWSTAASMPTARYVLAAVTPEGDSSHLIYAIAGAVYPYPHPLDTVEAYDPVTNSWTTKASLMTARYAPAAAVGPDGRSIYVFGGMTSELNPIASVERYDLTNWFAAPPMPTARLDLGAATSHGRIYAAGGTGFATPLILQTVEAFTP
jgi:N-acetylneuraminic acid mutarotase